MSVESRDRRLHWGIDAFVDEEGGFTTVAVALSLLVSLALVLSLVQVQWVNSRSSDVQAVADATAIAGCQVVRMYTEIAQVLDACIVTMGMMAVFSMGAGLALCFVPFLGGVGVTLTDFAVDVFTARKDFADSVATNLKKVEDKLPLLIYADSFTTATANSSDVGYVGIALPFPDEGKSDFGIVEVDPTKMAQANRDTAEATEEAEEAKENMDTALHDGWLADCGNEGACLRERARALVGLDTAYVDESSWNFGMALERARSYYAQRLANEHPVNDSVEEQANSAIRQAYYRYAVDELAKGVYEQNEKGEPTKVDLPSLPHDKVTTEGTRLYHEETWPCTREGEKRVIHAYEGCPGATGAPDGRATLEEMDHGGATRCEVCRLTTGQVGKVSSITFHADSGFEHHWALEVDASKRWTDAKEEYDKSEEARKDASEDGVDFFKEALALFKTPRVKLCPPGAWGCIAIVAKGETTPEELENGFTGGVDLPSGVAIAGATLAPDPEAGGNSLISHLLDSIEPGEGGFFDAITSFVLNLWSGVLEFYAGMASGIGTVTDGMFKGLEDFGFGWLGNPIKEMLTGAVMSLGLEPADLTQKKPVLCNTAEIMKKDGNTTTEKILDYVYAIDPDGTLWDAITAVAGKAFDDMKEKLKEKELDFGTFTIPIVNIPIDLKVPLGQLLGLGEGGS